MKEYLVGYCSEEDPNRNERDTKQERCNKKKIPGETKNVPSTFENIDTMRKNEKIKDFF